MLKTYFIVIYLFIFSRKFPIILLSILGIPLLQQNTKRWLTRWKSDHDSIASLTGAPLLVDLNHKHIENTLTELFTCEIFSIASFLYYIYKS